MHGIRVSAKEVNIKICKWWRVSLEKEKKTSNVVPIPGYICKNESTPIVTKQNFTEATITTIARGEGFNESQQSIKSGITSFLLKTENPRLPFPRETGI